MATTLNEIEEVVLQLKNHKAAEKDGLGGELFKTRRSTNSSKISPMLPHQVFPKTSPNPGRRALYWWSGETKTAVKPRRKALQGKTEL